jgi:hypothetical protein
MTTLQFLIDTLSRGPQELLYFTQGVTYALACWSIRCGRHASWRIYLVSSLIHFALGVIYHWSAH